MRKDDRHPSSSSASPDRRGAASYVSATLPAPDSRTAREGNRGSLRFTRLADGGDARPLYQGGDVVVGRRWSFVSGRFRLDAEARLSDLAGRDVGVVASSADTRGCRIAYPPCIRGRQSIGVILGEA